MQAHVWLALQSKPFSKMALDALDDIIAWPSHRPPVPTFSSLSWLDGWWAWPWEMRSCTGCPVELTVHDWSWGLVCFCWTSSSLSDMQESPSKPKSKLCCSLQILPVEGDHYSLYINGLSSIPCLYRMDKAFVSRPDSHWSWVWRSRYHSDQSKAFPQVDRLARTNTTLPLMPFSEICSLKAVNSLRYSINKAWASWAAF